MKPQILFFLIIIVLGLVVLNYQTIGSTIFGKETYSVSLETPITTYDPTTGYVTTIRKVIETTTKYYILTNSTNISRKTTEHKTEHPIYIKSNYNGYIDKVKQLLSKADVNTIKYINTINIVSLNEIYNLCDSYTAVGCIVDTYNDLSDIYLAESSSYKDLCNTFNNTLYHELGHLNNRKNHLIDSEEAAENYASSFYKDKCKSDEYKILESKLQNKLDEYNKTSEILSNKWDKYSCSTCIPNYKEGLSLCKIEIYDCGVPEELYYEYTKDYEKYNLSLNEYNKIILDINEYLNKGD